jgi:ABC-type transport system involved in cytochrome c biogenesis permease subunit
MKSLLFTAICLFMAGSVSRAFLWIGLAVEAAYLGMRGLAMGRLPLLGPHDTLVFFSAAIALMVLVTSVSPALTGKGWFGAVSGWGAALFTLLALMFPALNMPLPQILDTPWFEAHVVLAFFAYALFAIGALLCAAYLSGKDRGLLDLQFKTALAGWSFFSASMIAGGIWGYYAWGTYWLWTPKELWTSILWLFYALHLHLRLRGARWDILTAWLGIIGLFVTLFTYLGVSMLMKSSHGF